MENKKTVGEISRELMLKQPESTDPIEIAREMQKEYVDELLKCVNDAKKGSPGNFFVVVITKRERLLPNAFRHFYLSRSTCPTPDYDQSVWRYVAADDKLEYIWTIPDRETCLVLKANALQVADEERELLRFVLEFADGTLMERCQKLNGEKFESLELDPNATKE